MSPIDIMTFHLSPLIKKYKNFKKQSYNHFILGGDIGGTNTRLALFGINQGSAKSKPQLLISFNFQSNKLNSLSEAINTVLNHVYNKYKIKVTTASIAAAGPLSVDKNLIQPTNLGWNIDKDELYKKTKLKEIILLNDFESIGYGINMLEKQDIKVIKKGNKIPKAPIILIGAGTGLGKSTLIYDKHSMSYMPIPSEAGHSDFPVKNKEEFELMYHVKNREKLNFVSYEHLLSGHGLSDIYLFLRKQRKFKETKYTKSIDNSNQKPELISKYRNVDNTCKATFEIFKEYYARFAKNCALDTLAYGGVYITGKIAVNNSNIFDPKFVQYFEQNYKLAYILKKIPIYLILNYNVGLLGAAFAYHIKSLELWQLINIYVSGFFKSFHTPINHKFIY